MNHTLTLLTAMPLVHLVALQAAEGGTAVQASAGAQQVIRLEAERFADDPTPAADAIAFSDWGIDLHHPEGFWVGGIDAIHVYHGRRTCIPYRTLYSKNIGTAPTDALRLVTASDVPFGICEIRAYR